MLVLSIIIYILAGLSTIVLGKHLGELDEEDWLNSLVLLIWPYCLFVVLGKQGSGLLKRTLKACHSRIDNITNWALKEVKKRVKTGSEEAQEKNQELP